jgi:two-component system, OmpR family, sensor histidine kinase VicK
LTSIAADKNTIVEKTELLYGVEDVVGRGIQFMQNVRKTMDLFGDKNGPSIIMGYDVYKNNYIDVIKRGGKIRLITEITKDNIQYCKELMKIVTELRHLDGLTGGIAVSESEYMTTHTLREKQLLTQSFYSNAEDVVKQGQHIFNTFWSNAILAEERITEIEEGIKPDFIETIREPEKVLKLGLEMIKSAKEEVLGLFSTANAFHRQERSGMIPLLNDVAKQGVRVRILTPTDTKIEQLKENERKNEEGGKHQKHRRQQQQQQQQQIQIRAVEPRSHTRVSILIVDRQLSLSVELNDDTKKTTYEAIGLASYSNSNSTVLSYVSIFESLWLQTELYDKLKIHDKMQKEFIDVAAHELRTPIQPILGLSDVLVSKKGNIEEYKELLKIINGNARRLQRLTENILDITRIESQTLGIKKERFSLNEKIRSVIIDINNQTQAGSNKDSVKIIFEPKEDIFVQADRIRIYQVISNLLNNAMKFTKEGNITISIQSHNKEEDKSDKGEATLTVTDTGIGIHPEIFPKLFTKFATKSDGAGTGLGLYISKGIAEAHGGRIWAQNNRDRKGATFGFSLPLSC